VKFVCVHENRYVSEDGGWALTRSSRRKGWTILRAKAVTVYGVMAWDNVEFVSGSRADAEKQARTLAKR
jgi:hypothetical protein